MPSIHEKVGKELHLVQVSFSTSMRMKTVSFFDCFMQSVMLGIQ